MAYGIKLEVWGDLAAFNRPEMKVERVSYDVMTPSSARGILEAIYWKPQMHWVVHRIHVLEPIPFTHIRRNEISSKIPVKGNTGVVAAMKSEFGRNTLGIAVEEHRQQRAAMVLRDVRYGIAASIEVLEDAQSGVESSPEAKHLATFKRRALRGQYFHHPYLGVREFPAHFKLVKEFPECPPELRGDRDLGFMLHDIEFITDSAGDIIESHRGQRVTARPRFFRALLRNGIVRVPAIDNTLS